MRDDAPKLTILGKLFILLFIGACLYGAFWMLRKKPLGSREETSNNTTSTQTAGGQNTTGGGDGKAVQIGIAYGTEKQRWLTWATEEFAKTPAGKKIHVNLLPMGSLDGGRAAVNGDERINVWSPASALYKNIFIEEWTLKYNKPPIVREELLALSPMVFVMWQERYEAFTNKYKEVNFDTISKALHEPSGWDAIAQKPEWGLFKFGHTHPNQSNSGLMTLTLMAYDFHKKSQGLVLKNILDPAFQTWMNGTETAVTGLSNSTGNMMRDMVLRGPSSYDALFVYENVVIDYLKNAEGRWGNLHISYPRQNMWNENPYYILDAPWSSREQRQAAGTFLDFLLTEPIQREALKHGFRPGNPEVPVKFAESPFTTYATYGLQINVDHICEPPKAEVLNNLLAGWQRAQGSR